jgi:NAD(P) transhydrogenase subunit beta
MDHWQDLLIDLVVIAVFIAGIAQFRTPRGARRGNITTALAFAAALGLLVSRHTIAEPWVVAVAAVVGGALGLLISARITMTRIPALIALQNGAGGGASLIVSAVELARMDAEAGVLPVAFGVAAALVGGVALAGSAIAAAKLDGRVDGRPRTAPGHDLAILMLVAAAASMGVLLLSVTGTQRVAAVAILAGAALVLGAALSIRVGGADMPVMISLLNAFSGLAAAFVGVSIANQMLVAAGAMVGSSGTILTLVMAKAMNRSVGAILTGRQLAASQAAPPAEPSSAIGEAGPRPAASVIIVPGYGMALAQAQHEVAALAKRLSAAGKLVRFAVHPVAGRMPGHMHVLLAEADVDYDDLYEMDAINDDFASTDVAIVVGASDVVNPAAITVADTPISGMPILRVHEADAVIVCNLDGRPGYSGVPNPLYDDPKAILLFGDAKDSVTGLIGNNTP